MNSLILVAAALWSGPQPATHQPTRVERASPVFMTALESNPESWGPGLQVRGQNPTYDENPMGATLGTPVPQTYASPAMPGQPFSSSGTETYDPFMGGVDPNAGACGGGGPCNYGVYGPQPYRMGWSAALEGGYLFPANAAPQAGGDFKIVESHAELRYHTMGPNGWIWGWTPAVDIRNWDGPANIGLPGAVFGVSSDFKLASPLSSGFGVEFGFTPRVASDFENSPNSGAWFFDGRVVMTYQISDEWMLVGGAQYWDRVKDLWIPTGGVVWRPGDRWEFRFTYPKAQASVFLGNWLGGDTWFYASGEYHVEAYQVALNKSSATDTIQISDYRFMLGLRQEVGSVSMFVEGGIMIDRDAIFAGNTPDFRISDGCLIRSGIRF